MMNVWSVTNPVPVMVAPRSASMASSRKALPPTRRKTYSSPSAVRRTTPTRSLFEPGAIRVRVTVPVSRRSCAAISPSDVFGRLHDAIVLGVGDQDTRLRHRTRAFPRRLARRPLVLDHDDHLLLHAARLHRLAVIFAADDVERLHVAVRAESLLPGDLAYQVVQGLRHPVDLLPGEPGAVGGGLSGRGQRHAARRACGGIVDRR